MNFKNKTLLALMATIVISGCSSNPSKVEKKIETNYDSVKQRTDAGINRLVHKKKKAILNQSELPFVSSKSVKISPPLPEPFGRKVWWSYPQGIEMSHIASMISTKTGYRVYVADDVYGNESSGDATGSEGEVATDSAGKQSQAKGGETVFESLGNSDEVTKADELKVYFENKVFTTIKAVLDQVTSRARVDWVFDNEKRTIKIQRLFTELFNLSAMLPSQNLMPESIMEGASGGAPANIVPSKDIWYSTLETIQKMISTKGTVSVNEVSGLVVVRDNKFSLEKVAKFIKKINKSQQQRVLLNIEIVEYQYSDSENKGLNLTALYDGGSNYSLSVLDGAALGMSVLTPNKDTPVGSWAGSSAIVDALKKSGRVTKTIRKPIRVRNNQVTSISDSRIQGYLSSASTTATTNAGNTASLNLGYIRSGEAINALAHIVEDGNSVMLDMGINISNLNQLVDITSGGQTLQSPDVQEGKMLVSEQVRNGETMILTASEQFTTNETKSGLFDKAWWWLSGQDSKAYEKRAMIVIITPYITSPDIK